MDRTPHPEHHYDVEGHRIRGIEVGQGPPLVMLHGLGSRLEEYHDLTEVLKDHFKVYVWDQPGDGYSTSPDTPQTLSDRADMVAAVIDHLGLEQPFLMGASQGGFVAFKLLAHHPGKVSRALLISPAGGWTKKPLLPEFLLAMSTSPAPVRVPFFLATSFIQLNLCYDIAYPGRWERIGGYYKDLMQRDLKQTTGNYFRATAMAMDDSVLDEVGGIETPVRMLWGEHDYGMPPSQGKDLHSRMISSQLVLVKRCGHAMGTEKPDFVLAHARNWFLGEPLGADAAAQAL